MEKLYVAYGSNMNRSQMERRCPNAKALGRGILEGYSLEFRGRNGRGVATIIADGNNSVPVVLWTITEECEHALDVYEGFPTLYYKKDVSVEFEGRTVEAMAYIMAREYEDVRMSARPDNYYYEVIRQGYDDFGIDTTPLKEAFQRAIDNTRFPSKLKNEIIKVSKDGRTNMFDISRVIEIAMELGCDTLVEFLSERSNHASYSNFIIYGD